MDGVYRSIRLLLGWFGFVESRMFGPGMERVLNVGYDLVKRVIELSAVQVRGSKVLFTKR